MKKAIIGALVGGLLIFLWQFVSYPLANLHGKAMQYTDKQDALISAITSQGLEEGGYMLPNLPADATNEQHEQLMADMKGQAWMSIQYHSSYDESMGMNMVRGYLTNVVAVLLLSFILLRFRDLNFGTILSASVFTGLIIFLSSQYINHIWFQTFDLWAHFLDAILAWGLVGVWLGWYLPRGNTHLSSLHVDERAKAAVD